jgi:hypothetical protein
VKADPFVQLRLLELQALDSGLDRLAHRRRTLPELAELERLDAQLDRLRDAVVRSETEVSDLAREAAKFEREIEQVRARASGTRAGSAPARSPWPSSCRTSSARWRRCAAQSDLEDGELEVMERAETAQAELDELTAQRDAHLQARPRPRRGATRPSSRSTPSCSGRPRARRAGRDAAGGPARAVRADPRGRGRGRRGRDQPRALRRLPAGPDEQREVRDPRGGPGRGAAARGVRPDHGAHGGVRL